MFKTDHICLDKTDNSRISNYILDKNIMLCVFIISVPSQGFSN